MYYFAYGSNMNGGEMQRCCGVDFSFIGPAVLADFEFGFDRRRGCANIRKKKGSRVWGVLLDISDPCLKALDKKEHVDEGVYRKEKVVVNMDGDVRQAFAYMEDPLQFGAPAKQDYLTGEVIPGARENNLPQEWVVFLESFVVK